MSKNEVGVVYRKLDEIKELEGNPRKIKDVDFKRLCKSIRANDEYFNARPLILSNRTGELVVIAGNQRYKASKFLKLEKVPTYLIEGLDEKKEREIIIRDNVSDGAWDLDELSSWDVNELVEWGVKEKIKDKKDDDELPEIEFTTELLEKNNYVVLNFDNEVDWLNLMSIIDLPAVKNLGGNGKGVGRIIDGAEFINKLKE